MPGICANSIHDDYVHELARTLAAVPGFYRSGYRVYTHVPANALGITAAAYQGETSFHLSGLSLDMVVAREEDLHYPPDVLFVLQIGGESGEIPLPNLCQLHRELSSSNSEADIQKQAEELAELAKSQETAGYCLPHYYLGYCVEIPAPKIARLLRHERLIDSKERPTDYGRCCGLILEYCGDGTMFHVCETLFDDFQQALFYKQADPTSGRVSLRKRMDRISRGEDSSQAGGAALLQYIVEMTLEEFFEDMPDLMKKVRAQLKKTAYPRLVCTYQGMMQAVESLMASGDAAGKEAAETILLSAASVFSNLADTEGGDRDEF